MNKQTFEARLLAATQASIETASFYIASEMPPSYRYFFSIDKKVEGHLDYSNIVARSKDLSEIIDLLVRDGKIPRWIEISVCSVDENHTYFALAPAREFTDDEEQLIHKRWGNPPFYSDHPNLATNWEKGANIVSKTFEDFIVALKSENPRARQAAVEMLGQLGDKAATEHLLAAISGADLSILTAIIYSLEKLRDVRAVPALATILDGKSNDARFFAVIALGEIGSNTAFEPLLDILQDTHQSEHVRAAAAVALGKIGDKRAIAPLIEIFLTDDDDTGHVRSRAAKGLGLLKDKAALKSLLQVLDQNEFLVGSIVNALGEVGDVTAIEPLLGVVKRYAGEDKDSVRIRTAAEKALADITSRNEYPAVAP